MRISLINPNLSGDVSILDIGLTYLATYINERTSHQAQIIDFTFHRKNWKRHLKYSIEQSAPDMVGITCTSLYLAYIQAIAKDIKDLFGFPIICGGYQASLLPEETLAMAGVDAICIGEGEYALTEYLDALENKRGLSGIRGIWAKDNGKIIKNPLRELTKDIDSFPVPNYELWEDIDKYLYFNQLLYFIGNRGCPYSCTYCSEQPLREIFSHGYLRTRNPRSFAREIAAQWGKYKKRNMRLAHTFDPVFTLNLDWMREFCDEYVKLGLHRSLPFSCFTRGDLMQEEKVKLLAASGCRILRIGIESGSEYIREHIYEKKISNGQFRNAVQLCKKYGIAITGYYILGGPGENKKTLNDTFVLAKELDVTRPVFFMYQPLPKTKAVEKLLQAGGTVEYERMRKVDSLHHFSAIKTKDLTSRDIELFQYKCFLYFVGGRTIRLIKKQGFKLIRNFFGYMRYAFKEEVPMWYAIAYFIICCEDNLIT